MQKDTKFHRVKVFIWYIKHIAHYTYTYTINTVFNTTTLISLLYLLNRNKTKIMFGWMDGHMNGWVETEAGLRNCYAQFKNIKIQKKIDQYLTRQHMSSKVIYSYLLGVFLTLIFHQHFCKNKNTKMNSNTVGI